MKGVIVLLALGPFMLVNAAKKSKSTRTEHTKTTLTHCNTKYGKSSLSSVPTRTVTNTAPNTATTTVYTPYYPSTTVTPATQTKTTTLRSTTIIVKTASTRTKTATTTTTSTSTSIEISTYTSTSTSIVSTTSTSTSYTSVPTPSGFVDISSSTGYSNYTSGNKRSLALHRAVPRGGKFGSRRLNAAALIFEKEVYPKEVTCTDTVRHEEVIEIIIQRPTRTITAATPLATQTNTKIVTKHSTTHPERATTTTTISESTSTVSTSTTTSVSTTTTTNTANAVVTAAVYDACNANNLLGPQIQNGQYVDGMSVYASVSYVSTNAATGYNCCAQCQQQAGCEWMQFIPNSGCYFYYNTNMQCSASYNYGKLDSTSESQYGSIFANGPCGYATAG